MSLGPFHSWCQNILPLGPHFSLKKISFRQVLTSAQLVGSDFLCGYTLPKIYAISTAKTKELTFLLCRFKNTHYLSVNTTHSKLIWILSMKRDFCISWAITEMTGSLEMWVSAVLCLFLITTILFIRKEFTMEAN